MIKIYTILADGQSLMPEVMQGILNQTIKCKLVPISSPGDYNAQIVYDAEISRARNWNRAKELCEEEIFVGMDSDVQLVDNNAIEMIINELKIGEYDMVCLPTRGLGSGHQVFAVWKDKFPKLIAEEGNCCMCKATTQVKYKCLDFEQKEVDRNAD